MYNPNIERIQIEQIQEFKYLDLHEIGESTDPGITLGNKLVLLAFDLDTQAFKYIVYDLDSSGGTIIINNNSTLERQVVVQTDKLPVPRGFVFNTGLNLTEVLEILVKELIAPIFTLTATPYLVEVRQNTDITLATGFIQGDGGSATGAPRFRRGTIIVAGSPDILYLASVGTVTYTAEQDTLASPDFPADTLIATDTVKAIYPTFYGTESTDALPSLDPSDKSPVMVDVPNNLDITFNGTSGYNWFAVHSTFTPTSWVEVKNGNENPLNGGAIPASGFIQKSNVSFNGNTYTVWMNSAPTDYTEIIRIKF